MLFIVLIFAFLPSIAFAAHSHRRAIHTPSTPVEVPSSMGSPMANPVSTHAPSVNKLCYNYGHQPLPYNWVQVDADMAAIKATGCTSVRLAYYGFNDPNVEALALRVKADGMSPIIGGSWGTFTQSQFTQYENEVIQQAKWAQANGISQISLGNEQEYRLDGVTQAAWASDLRAIASAVRAVYSGKISYETSGDFSGEWADQSLGDIDLLGLNLYCGYGCNSAYLQEAIQAFGASHVYISETNCDLTGSQNCPNDVALSAEVQADAVMLLSFGVPEYFFAYRSGGDGTSAVWGIFNGNSVQYPQTWAELQKA